MTSGEESKYMPVGAELQQRGRQGSPSTYMCTDTFQRKELNHVGPLYRERAGCEQRRAENFLQHAPHAF